MSVSKCRMSASNYLFVDALHSLGKGCSSKKQLRSLLPNLYRRFVQTLLLSVRWNEVSEIHLICQIYRHRKIFALKAFRIWLRSLWCRTKKGRKWPAFGERRRPKARGPFSSTGIPVFYSLSVAVTFSLLHCVAFSRPFCTVPVYFIC